MKFRILLLLMCSHFFVLYGQSDNAKKKFVGHFYESFKNNDTKALKECFVDSIMMNNLFKVAELKEEVNPFTQKDYDELYELRGQAENRYMESINIHQVAFKKEKFDLKKTKLDSINLFENKRGPASSFGAKLFFKEKGFHLKVIVFDSMRKQFFVIDDNIRTFSRNEEIIDDPQAVSAAAEAVVEAAIEAVNETNVSEQAKSDKKIETSKVNQLPQSGTGILHAVEVMPEFPGGENKMYDFIVNHLLYPKEAAKKKTEGMVYIQFVVEKDGSVSQSKIVKDIGDGCGRAAKAVVDKMPKWKPGMNKGKPVRVYFTLPFDFTLVD